MDGITLLNALKMVMSLLLVQEIMGHLDIEIKNVRLLQLEGKHITQVKCGQYYTMVMTSSGYVFTWSSGRLGHDTSQWRNLSIPCLVDGLREHNGVLQIPSFSINCACCIDPNPSRIHQSHLYSFGKKERCDVVFKVEKLDLYANVNVLSDKSDYFAARFRSNMRERV